MCRIRFAVALTFLVLTAGSASAQSSAVEVEALMGQSAVLKIDGQRKMLRVGETHQGVTLLSADSSSVTLDIDGRQETLGLSRRIVSNYQEPTEQQVSIPRNGNNQYETIATINGRTARVLIDTGANVVAMSAVHARSLGIDTSNAKPGHVQTASGLSEARAVNLRSVSVGGISVNNVQATVVDGNFPVTILLGMSYLQHVKISENNGVLSLSRVQ